MFISEEVCAARGLSSKSYQFRELNKALKIDPQELKRKLEGLPTEPQQDKKVLEIFQEVEHYSVLLHELVHNCIPDMTRNSRDLACQEFAGNSVEFIGKNFLLDTICSDPALREKGKPSRVFCGKLCVSVFEKEVVSEWTRCICTATDTNNPLFGDWLSPEECCSCNYRCKSFSLKYSDSKIPKFCEQDLFNDPEIRSQLEEQHRNLCEQLAFNPNHYSCGKFSRNGAESFKECK